MVRELLASKTLQSIYDVPAPAKLNLFLHLTGRRPDGYHLLQSAFMLIDWCDRLHFEARTDGKIARKDAFAQGGWELPEDDLCVRAARALRAATGTALGVTITLEKQVPTQAGMGGGSSDAATCLLALQRLWGVRLPKPALHTLALALGADVPFFLFGSNAWAEGIGDELTLLPLAPAYFVVVKPPDGVGTAEIFRAPGLKRDTPAATIAGFAAHRASQNVEFGLNDLQSVAQVLCPQIIDVLSWMELHQLSGRMTGSGSAVFAQVDENWQVPVAPSGWTVRKCRNLPVHPLAGW